MKKRTIIWLSALLALLLGIVSMASIADSALDIALNASGGSLSFINDGAYPWQVVSIDGRTAAMSGNRGCHSTDSSVRINCSLALDIRNFVRNSLGDSCSLFLNNV